MKQKKQFCTYSGNVILSKVYGWKWQKYKINSCAKSAWYARRQHSYNICKDFLSHNSWMKNLNLTNSCTINMNWNIYTISIQLKTKFFEKSVKTINSNNSTKFEVNWWRGSQFTVRHTKNRLQFDEWSPITLKWKIEISPKSIQTIRLSIPITMRSLKWIGRGVLNLQRDIRKIAYNLMNIVEISP